MKNMLNRFVTVLLVVVVAFAVLNLGKALYKYWLDAHKYDKVTELAGAEKFTGDIDFDKLSKENPDIAAWLYQKGGKINYPVVQANNNSKYLDTLFDGSYGASGCLFVDCRNSKDFSDSNTIIYGHHMKDGSMFGKLEKYKSQKYYKKHKRMELITPEGKFHLKIVSAYVTNTKSDAYDVSFEDDLAKQAFIDEAASKSAIKCKSKAKIEDRLVTLSTCSYEFHNARFVVVGKLVPWKK